MQVVTLPVDCYKGPSNSYILTLLTHGHEPGYLSLNKLKGKAKKYMGSYYRARHAAYVIAAKYGVEHGDVLVGARHAHVWKVGAEPAKLVIAGLTK